MSVTPAAAGYDRYAASLAGDPIHQEELDPGDAAAVAAFAKAVARAGWHVLAAAGVPTVVRKAARAALRLEAARQVEEVAAIRAADAVKAEDDATGNRRDIANPQRLARVFLRRHHHHPDNPTLVHWRDRFYRWDRRCWVEDQGLEARLVSFLDAEFARANRVAVLALEEQQDQDAEDEQEPESATASGAKKRPKKRVVPPPTVPAVTEPLVRNVLRALQALVHLPGDTADPSWIGKYERTEGKFPAAEVLACRNELVHLPEYVAGAAEHLFDPTPFYFSLRCLPYDFDPGAAVPDLLVKYLERAFPECPESRELAVEWAGYLLLPDTSRQKMMMLYGVSGAGKGVYVDLVRAILGPGNSATATLGSMGESFGLAGFIGKSLATIDDARLGGKNERGALLERLLTISGGGWIAVNRKGGDYWEGKLPTRLMLVGHLSRPLP